ncbi:OmpA/MotB family protein [Persephonella sp.]
MARKKKEECPSVPAWVISFSDLMSLLLTFFILLYSMSVLDIKKLMKFLWYFQGEEPFIATKTVTVIPPISLLQKDIALEIKNRIKRILPMHAYQIEAIENYIVVRLFNDVIFKPDSAELTEKSKKALSGVANALKALDKAYTEILVNGHAYLVTKNVDPWKLSIKRAVVVAQYLIDHGVNPEKIAVTGYGNTKPVYTWNHPLLKRRNDRVEIFIKLRDFREDLMKDEQNEKNNGK